MAVLLNGMSTDETVALTQAMLHSGDVMKWNSDKPIVDKHSTGGLGDKVSIPLAPMLACCGVSVPMISGRGLGPTGGTLDKLESIPGFRTDLSTQETQALATEIGCVITGASPEIAPADKKLYALRDVTGTVESIPLITASILSKKLAAGLDALILDVKFGSGAFMKTLEQATQLAESLVSVGNLLGVKTKAILTDMNQVLGSSAGNAIEIDESIRFLNGDGPEDLMEVTLSLGANLLSLVNDEPESANRTRLAQTIYDENKPAFTKLNQMIQGQGGSDFSYQINHTHPLYSPKEGFLSAIDARKIGFAVIELGGGRKQLGDELDLGVGIRQLVRIGDRVTQADPLFEVVSNEAFNEPKLQNALRLLDDSFQISESPVPSQQLICKTIG